MKWIRTVKEKPPLKNKKIKGEHHYYRQSAMLLLGYDDYPAFGFYLCDEDGAETWYVLLEDDTCDATNEPKYWAELKPYPGMKVGMK